MKLMANVIVPTKPAKIRNCLSRSGDAKMWCSGAFSAGARCGSSTGINSAISTMPNTAAMQNMMLQTTSIPTRSTPGPCAKASSAYPTR